MSATIEEILTGVDPTEIDRSFVLGISPSMKPVPGSSAPSATRSLLLGAFATLRRIYPRLAVIDLRHAPLPAFDGRLPEQVDHPHVRATRTAIASAGVVYVAIPGYWGAVSSSFKNLIEVMCGAAYDEGAYPTVFDNKSVGFFVIGADEPSALAAAQQAHAIFEAVGARVMVPPVVASAGAGDGDLGQIGQKIVAALAELVRGLGDLPDSRARSRR